MSMRKLTRIMVAGVITGGIWYFCAIVSLHYLGAEFLVSISSVRRLAPWSGFFFLAIDLLMGIWVIALFALIRSQFKSHYAASLVCSLFWWLMKTLESVKWLGLGILPESSVLGLAITSLISMFVATLVGAWLYSRASA
jgi:hypothetical protein